VRPNDERSVTAPTPARGPSSKAVAAGIVVSVVAGVFLLWGVSFRDLGNALAGGNLVWLFPALALFIAMFGLRAWRWSILLGGTRFAPTWHANLIGYFFNIVLPLRLGEIARAYVISKNGAVTMTRALAAVLVERLIDLASVLLLFAWFTHQVPMRASLTRVAALVSVGVAVAVIGAVLVVVKGEAVENAIAPRLDPRKAELWLSRSRQIRTALRAVGSARQLTQSLVLTVGIWTFTILVASMCLRAFLPENSGGTQAGLVVVMANLGGALPSAPGGLGVVQGFATSALVVPFGVEESRALAFVLVWSLGQLLVLLVLGFASIGRVGLSFREIRAAAGQRAAAPRIDPRTTAD
jgi:glycosyltransferase 2 family protein